MNLAPLYRKLLVVSGTAMLLSVVALAGCSSPKASELTTPAIVWEGGEPSGPLWDTEWAAAYREAVIQLALADAYGDFSDPDFIAALGYDAAVSEAKVREPYRFDPRSDQRRFYERDGMFAYEGTILDIVESADGTSALVSGCTITIRPDEVVGYPQDWLITRLPDGSHTASRKTPSHPACVDAQLWVGRWAERIDIEDVGRDKVKMPLPRDYYVKLGVISE